MSRTSRAADAAIPDTEPVPDTPTTQGATEPAGQESATPGDGAPWGRWRFVGDGPLTYAGIPVTVVRGDIITHPTVPADDGRWEPTDGEATRLPDNHRPDPTPLSSGDTDTSEEG